LGGTITQRKANEDFFGDNAGGLLKVFLLYQAVLD
jgi:hypothetical protein